MFLDLRKCLIFSNKDNEVVYFRSKTGQNNIFSIIDVPTYMKDTIFEYILWCDILWSLSGSGGARSPQKRGHCRCLLPKYPERVFDKIVKTN